MIQRHNEVRDSIRDLSAVVWSQVKHEPVVRDADNQKGILALKADLAVRGVWLPQAEALFDIRIIDTDAQFYINHSPKDVLSDADKPKKINTVGL